MTRPPDFKVWLRLWVTDANAVKIANRIRTGSTPAAPVHWSYTRHIYRSPREIDKNCTISEGVFNASDWSTAGGFLLLLFSFDFVDVCPAATAAATAAATGVVCLTRGHHPSTGIVTKSWPRRLLYYNTRVRARACVYVHIE